MDFYKMKNSKHLNGTLLAIALIYTAEAQRNFNMEILNFHVNATRPEIFARPVNSSFNKKQISLEYSLAQTVTECTAKLGVDILVNGNEPSNLLKVEANICSGLKSGSRNHFLAVLFRELIRASNLPKNCLMVANRKYYVRNYTVREDDYPPFSPKVMWQVHMDIVFDKKSAMILYIKGRNNSN